MAEIFDPSGMAEDMVQHHFRRIIEKYEKLREAGIEAKLAGDAVYVDGEYLHVNAGYIAYIEARADGVAFSGEAWTNRYGGSNEAFEFIVPYDKLPEVE